MLARNDFGLGWNASEARALAKEERQTASNGRQPTVKTDEVGVAKEVCMTVAELNTPLKSSTNVAFRNILVATDFSEPSRRALLEALTLATENNAQLSIIHVLPPERLKATFDNPPELDLERVAAEKQIETLLVELKPQQKIGTLVKHGHVAVQVLSMIEEKAIDLLVIGTRGRGGVRKLALGSVAEELLRVAPCPVMTIGPRRTSPRSSTDPACIRSCSRPTMARGR